jgi:hypothetical protein
MLESLDLALPHSFKNLRIESGHVTQPNKADGAVALRALPSNSSLESQYQSDIGSLTGILYIKMASATIRFEQLKRLTLSGRKKWQGLDVIRFDSIRFEGRKSTRH